MTTHYKFVTVMPYTHRRISDGVLGSIKEYSSIPNGADAYFVTDLSGFRSLITEFTELAVNTSPISVSVKTVTKLALMTKLVALNKWDLFKEFLLTLPQINQDAWMLAQEIADNNPLFVASRDAFISSSYRMCDKGGSPLSSL